MSKLCDFEISRAREILEALFRKHHIFTSRVEVNASIGADNSINIAAFVKTPTAPLAGLGAVTALLAPQDSAFIDLTTGAINFYQVPIEQLGPMWPR